MTVLPREQLDYEISQISINQKHDNFENLCRKLAEKLISPNLIPQVGPTGGGDGKTDTETYPVSSFVFDRWYISDNKWNENENWAFAISAKTDWKPKVKSDVKKIVETNRGYTKVYFFSNQKISSKNKKETQDQAKADHGIELIILDAEWILEKVYTNNLLNDVIDSLNLSRVYLEEKVIGPNDAERIKALAEIEEKINSTGRFFEVDFQLVEDCLESAIISRSLELPKAEVIGKFERAKRFATKLNSRQLKIRIHYQLAWTLINWYDDYKEFYSEYSEFKFLVHEEPNLSNLEEHYTLFTLITTISNIEDAKNQITIDFIKEEEDFLNLLNSCSLNENKISTALLAKYYLAFVSISKNFQNETVISEELVKLKGYFEKSKLHLDMPFEQLKEMVEKYGKLLPNNNEFDNLIDTVAELDATRVSELSAGKLYLNRGITKLENNYNKESLIYFGKAARKFAKDESQTQFYFCLMLLSDAYSKLDLYWASYSALVAAANIYAQIWYTTGNLNPRLYRSIESILKNEVIVGRIPVLLCWHELFRVVKNFLPENDTKSKQEIATENMIDACLAIRLLNSPVTRFKEFMSLPDILNNCELWLGNDAALYLLGHEDLIVLDETKTSITKEMYPDYYNKIANQPFVEQIAYDTNLMDNSDIDFETRILGIKFKITTVNHISLILLSETILAYFESFLATSFEEVFPLSEEITLTVNFGDVNSFFNFSSQNKNTFQILVKESYSYTGKDVSEMMYEILPQIIANNYLFKDYKNFLDNLYQKDEVHERLSLIHEHKVFLTNVLTTKPKLFLSDWKTENTKNYDLKRESSPITIKASLQKTENGEQQKKPDFNQVTHRNIKAETIIDSPLWDKAKWQAFGFLATHTIPFAIFLGFENGEAGKKIFEDWILQYGKVDKNEIISLTIVKGINKENPHWYKILVDKKIEKEKIKDGDFVSLSARFHRMEPKNGDNLAKVINGFELYKQYVLIPVQVDSSFNVKHYPELGILKTHLKIINAWEIGIHDFERVVITEDDNPIIPDNIANAPVLEVLKEKKNKKG